MIGIIGTGGHAKVVADIFRRAGMKRITFFSNCPGAAEKIFWQEPVLPDSPESIGNSLRRIGGWHVAIGDPNRRKEKTELVLSLGGRLLSAIHDRCVIAEGVIIGNGSAVMAGAVINSGTVTGQSCIVNTAASVDHDCTIADYVSIGPGCRITGGVAIGELAALGAGAVVIPGKKIGGSCIIGAGAVIITDVPEGCVAVGVPARTIKTGRDGKETHGHAQ